MINIVCVKWGTKYGPEYVNRLYAGVKRNTTVPFKFHCFTDNTTGLQQDIIAHPLKYNSLEGWWNKLYLFSDELSIPIGEKIVFLDLDTLIVGNINDVLNLESDSLITARDFLTSIISTIRTNDHMQSCIMIWPHGRYANVWRKFIQDPTEAIASVKPHGDQRWIQAEIANRVYLQDLLPEKIVSFKVACRSGLPKNATIVCYHGRPSIIESATQEMKVWKWQFTPQSWVLDHWKDQ